MACPKLCVLPQNFLPLDIILNGFRRVHLPLPLWADHGKGFCCGEIVSCNFCLLLIICFYGLFEFFLTHHFTFVSKKHHSGYDKRVLLCQEMEIIHYLYCRLKMWAENGTCIPKLSQRVRILHSFCNLSSQSDCRDKRIPFVARGITSKSPVLTLKVKYSQLSLF